MVYMSFITKVKYTYDLFFHSDRIKTPLQISEQLEKNKVEISKLNDDITHKNRQISELNSEIYHHKGVIKCQQVECANLIDERDALWDTTQRSQAETKILKEVWQERWQSVGDSRIPGIKK